jgi:hypothetical protein
MSIWEEGRMILSPSVSKKTADVRSFCCYTMTRTRLKQGLKKLGAQAFFVSFFFHVGASSNSLPNRVGILDFWQKC